MWLAVWSAIERHGDHANKDTIKKVIQYGIPVYSCEEVAHENKGVMIAKKGRKTSIGGFKIQPIPLQHSCECFGYLIETSDNQRIVFATDCCEFLYKIKNVNHWLIECNWSEDILIDNMCDNAEMRSRHEHHLELNDTIFALKENFSSSMNTVVLLHLSNGNSNEEMFKSRISEELGFFNIHIAKKGLSLQLQDDF
jgi:phosphoribosyl 1,2-cyclic phosphodiesterase